MRVDAVDRQVMLDGSSAGAAAAACRGAVQQKQVGVSVPEPGTEAQWQAANVEDVRQATEALNETVRALNGRLSFVLHEESGRMQVRVIDNQTQEVVKEIPPTEVLEVVARIREMIGVLLDKKV